MKFLFKEFFIDNALDSTQIVINSIKHIMVIETSDKKIANTLKNNTASHDQDILVLDSIQSVDKEKMKQSYLDIMESNLNVLAQALDTEPAE